MKFIAGLFFGAVFILLGISSLVLYVSLRTKAYSWLTSFGIFSLFGLGVGLIALGIRFIMVIFREPVDRKKN